MFHESEIVLSCTVGFIPNNDNFMKIHVASFLWKENKNPSDVGLYYAIPLYLLMKTTIRENSCET